MYVYIWKDPNGTPFYVGCTRNMRRTNPRNNGSRNWLCQSRINEIGADSVLVEIHVLPTQEAGAVLEQELIAKHGRIQLSNGPLTNLRTGGDGLGSKSLEHKEKLRLAMLNPAHPIHSAASREKAKKRMNDPDVKAKFLGDANPAKREEVREKIKAVWADPAYKEKMRIARTGLERDLPETTKEVLRKNLAANPDMKGWGERNGKDAEFDAKRVAGIRAAQGSRTEKMRDPAALAQRKARLKATLNSPEFKAKRVLRDTPEYREKLSAARRAYWSAKRATA